jgi:cytochrome c
MNAIRLVTTAAAALSALCTAGAHAQDVAAGRQAYAQCAACHSIDGSPGVGPSLKGVVGREAGSAPGFRFSRAMKGAGYPWDARKLDAYIANPQNAVPGNVMPYAGLDDAKQRADLVAYLASLK